MKKLLLFLSFLTIGFTQAQTNVFAFGFDGTTTAMVSAGWQRTNQSTSASATSLWNIPAYTAVTVSSTVSATAFQNQAYTTGQVCPVPNGQAGGGNSFAIVNYTSTTATDTSGDTISNWLISPVINVQNGDVVTFYSRIGKYSATNTASYADNMQFRMSTNGAASVVPSTGPTDLGDFTTLCNEINPNLNLTSYPATWTQYSYTVSGLTAATDVMFAFRYYVTNGGLNGSNSDIIGIDTFSVDRPAAASAQQFFTSNFAVSPNPAKDFVNITSKSNVTLNNASITDINGRIVKEANLNGSTNSQITISDLSAGVYFLKIASNQGVGTTKIIKE